MKSIRVLKTMTAQQIFFFLSFKSLTIDLVRLVHIRFVIFCIILCFPFIFQDTRTPVESWKISDLGLRIKMPKGFFFFTVYFVNKRGENYASSKVVRMCYF